eukprot:668264-Pelagomonas_calceolata.AAC.11
MSGKYIFQDLMENIQDLRGKQKTMSSLSLLLLGKESLKFGNKLRHLKQWGCPTVHEAGKAWKGLINRP